MSARNVIPYALVNRARAYCCLGLAALAALVLLAAGCAGDAEEHDEPAPTPTAAGSPTAAPEPADDADAAPDRVEGDGPPPGEERESAVLTVSTGLDLPERVAIGGDGSRVLVTEDGRILHHDGDSMTPLGRIAENASLRGVAIDPQFPDEPYLYLLLERDDDRLQVYRFILEDGALHTDGVISETNRGEAAWGGNGLLFGRDGALYAALGGTADDRVSLDLEALASGEGANGDAPCGPWTAAGGAELGPWVAVHGNADGSPPALSAPVWTIEGAVATAVYTGERIPQWWGSLFIVTDDGDLIRVPRGDDDCFDYAESEVLYADDYGRIRDVSVGPEGDVYLLTANGAGATHPHDDRLLRIGPVDDLDLLYPDLRTQPPANLQFDRAWVDDASRPVLRFTNTVMNLGDGPLEIYDYGEGYAVQRVYTADGAYLERRAGELVWHWSHAHFHFDHFNRFELWEQEAYERMLEGDEDAEPAWVHDKVSMCLMDLIPVVDEPERGDYGTECVRGAQGISVGWGDVYFFDIDEQWVVLDGEFRDGDYVLRSIVDSENLFHESPGGSDPERESHEANGATTWFTISGGGLSVTHTESGAGEQWAP